MNVGGIPFAEGKHGFALVSGLVVGLTALLAWLAFRDRDR
jgi:zinc transporter